MPPNLKRFDLGLYDIFSLVGLKTAPHLQELNLIDPRSAPFGMKVALFLLKILDQEQKALLMGTTTLRYELWMFIVTHLWQERAEFVKNLNAFIKQYGEKYIVTEFDFGTFHCLFEIVEKLMNRTNIVGIQINYR